MFYSSFQWCPSCILSFYVFLDFLFLCRMGNIILAIHFMNIFFIVQFSSSCLSFLMNKCFPVSIIEMHIFSSICIWQMEIPSQLEYHFEYLSSCIDMRASTEHNLVTANLRRHLWSLHRQLVFFQERVWFALATLQERYQVLSDSKPGPYTLQLPYQDHMF